MNRRDLLLLGIALPAIAAGQAPVFFTRRQYDTMVGFSDLVIPATDTPGAKEAGVADYLDRLLAASDPSFQVQFLADLDALGATFVDMTTGEQTKLLEQVANTAGFNRLKAWTARMYYATEIGFNELNKDGRVPAGLACG
jgi:hypothetical protein